MKDTFFTQNMGALSFSDLGVFSVLPSFQPEGGELIQIVFSANHTLNVQYLLD